MNAGPVGNTATTFTVSDGNLNDSETIITVNDVGGQNVAPTANANGPYTGTTGVAVGFSSAGSNDSDGTITAYAWSFGDGGTSSAANPTMDICIAL